jgi:hypothetical protein
MLNTFLAFLHEHGLVLTPPAVGAVLLLVVRYVVGLQTPEQWVSLGERFPRVQGFFRFLRGAGLDPVKAVQGLVQMVTGTVTPDSALRAAELAVENAALRAALARLGASPAAVIEAAEVGRASAAPNPQSGRAALSALLVLVVGFTAVLPLCVALTGCLRPTPPSDGGTSTPAAWTDTASTVLHALAWALPAAEVIVDATVPEPQRAVVDRAIAGTVEAATGLQSALDAYVARGGDRCAAYAAVGGLTRAFVVLAQTLADQGIALGTTLTPIVQSLGAIADQLVPACQADAGFASAGDATARTLRAIEADAAAHGRVLRPVLDGLHPAVTQ